MKFIDFIYPSTNKVILSIILIYPIFIFVFYIGTGLYIDCAEGYYTDQCGYHPPMIGFELGLIGSIIIAIVITYILACALNILYKKIRYKLKN